MAHFQRNKLRNKWIFSMRKTGQARPHKRDGIWYLIRRVPKEFQELDRRQTVRISTMIAVADDPRGVHAREAVRKLDAELQAYWRGLRDGQSAEARLRFEAAQKRARAIGLPYLTNAEIAEQPLDDIINRLKLIIDRGTVEDENEVAAIMGGEDRPQLKISDLVDEFAQIESQEAIGKSENQRKKWLAPKRRAAANLIEVIGDKELTAITRADALAFRSWWQERVVSGGRDIGTANKDLGHISKMIRLIEMTHQIGLQPVFANLRLSGEVDKQRAAFLPEFVQSQILSSGALDALNDEARHIVWLIADTGLRLSEAANLTAETIHLDAEVPYISVRPDGRRLKTPHSARDIPLVGCALEAMKLHPNGFPRYRDKAASLSALVNKSLGGRDLLPTKKHSLYSLRHTFEDRLTAVEAPEKLVAALMGHKWIRPKYGAGPSLAQKRGWLQKIAFKPPGHD